MRVLVTGASSLLGRHTVTALQNQGHLVTAFQRSPSNLEVREFLGDISSAADVATAMAEQDGVIHLAAKVSPTGRLADFERVNIHGTRNVLSAAQAAEATKIVHVSSPSVAHGGSALVGVGSGTADPSATRGHYSTTKAKAELLALDAACSDLSVVAIRPHLVWGPGDTQLVGRIIDRTRAGRMALIGSGLALIDSVYVNNAADALVAALTRADQVSGEALVVSNGEPRTIQELIERILGAAGLELPDRSVSPRLAFGVGRTLEMLWDGARLGGEPPMTSFLAEQLSTAHWFDQRRTQKLLDWVPAISLDEGFARLAAAFARDDQPGATSTR